MCIEWGIPEDAELSLDDPHILEFINECLTTPVLQEARESEGVESEFNRLHAFSSRVSVPNLMSRLLYTGFLLMFYFVQSANALWFLKVEIRGLQQQFYERDDQWM